MSARFDEATTVVAGEGGSYQAVVVGDYNIGPVPNGGYVMSIALAAIQARLPGCDPLTMTAHFLRPAIVAPARVDVEVVKEGRRYATVRARLWQGGDLGAGEVLSVLATLTMAGAPAPAGEPLTLVDGSPPELGRLEELERVPRTDFYAIGGQLDFRLERQCAGWMRGERSGRADMRGAIRFADGRPLDLLSIPLLADATTPAVFGVIPFRRVPTLELTVHFRARPAPGSWLRFTSRTRFAFAGHLEEDGELWDDAGQLVAQSRELAVVP